MFDLTDFVQAAASIRIKIVFLLEFYKFLSFQLRDTDDDLGTGSRVLSVMIMRVQRSRLVLALVGVAIIAVIVICVYLSFNG